MSHWQGDYALGQNIDIYWNSYNSLGAPVTRSSQGTITVYKDGGTTEQSHGVTDNLNFDSKTGFHLCRVSSASSAFFVAGSSYAVYVSGDTIDGQFFAGCIGTFSIGHRHLSIATYAEMTAVPSATGPTIPQMIQWPYTLSRLSMRQTATVATVYTSALTAIATSATTDDGTNFDTKQWA